MEPKAEHDTAPVLDNARLTQQSLLNLSTAEELASLFYSVIHRQSSLCSTLLCMNDRPASEKHPGHGHDGALIHISEFPTTCVLSADELDATSRSRTGTKPYLGHEQQDVDWKGPHRYRHDLESVFYVMTLFLYSTPSEKILNAFDEDHHSEKWDQEDDEYLGGKKLNFIGEPEWDPTVKSFFAGFHSWLHKIHTYFFDGFALQKMQRRIAIHWTDEDESDQDWTSSERILAFNEDTLGGHVSFDGFVLVMHEFIGAPLDTHYPTCQKGLSKLKLKSKSRRVS
ncbi:hypothetical protein C8R42DRAFT_728081 [Lentinula raphanica]|nr:hypothetical protein C8R42DRAFT_728081 [Lentinula raphanica]